MSVSAEVLQSVMLTIFLCSVQLRPMVRSLGHALMYDVSLFERLYKGPDIPGLSKTMLNVSVCNRYRLHWVITLNTGPISIPQGVGTFSIK